MYIVHRQTHRYKIVIRVIEFLNVSRIWDFWDLNLGWYFTCLAVFRVIFFHIWASIIIPVFLLYNMVDFYQAAWDFLNQYLPGFAREFLPAVTCLLNLYIVSPYIDRVIIYCIESWNGLVFGQP